MADFAEEKERGKVVDDLGQNPLMEKNLFLGFRNASRRFILDGVKW